MAHLLQPGRPAIAGGAMFATLYSGLALSEDGHVPALQILEHHVVFHLLLTPVYALLVLGYIQTRAAIDQRSTRLSGFASSLATFGLGVGVLAGAIVPLLEIGFDVNTSEGAVDAGLHMPEFMPLVVGSLLFGISTAISRSLPRPAGFALALGAILMFVLGAGGAGVVQIIGAIAFGAGLVSVGVAISISERRDLRQFIRVDVAS